MQTNRWKAILGGAVVIAGGLIGVAALRPHAAAANPVVTVYMTPT